MEGLLFSPASPPQPPSKNGSLAISILFEAQEFCYLIP